MEDTFPWALIDAINAKGKGEVEAVSLQIGAIHDNDSYEYDLILDRISHEVPFYRTYLKAAVTQGVAVINNPFWWSADDKFTDNIVADAVNVAVPKTVLLPHKQHPPNTEAKSFRNMRFVDWERVFDYLGFPIFMKPADGGGWKDVYKCDDRDQFFAAYDQSRSLTMIAQEAIDFKEYFRCYVLGRSRVHIMRYDPRQPHHLRYVVDRSDEDPALVELVRKGALALCDALGYDLNTVEFAVRDGIPYAIDFMNPAPDADVASVGKANFDWVVDNMADVLIERVLNPRPFEAMGNWPKVLLPGGQKKKAADKPAGSSVSAAPARKASPSAKRGPTRPGKSR